MGMLFCCVALVFFSGLYLVVGQSQKKGVDPMGLNLAAFCAGALFSTAAALPLSAARFPPRLIAVGVLIGFTAGGGLLGTALAVRKGVGLSVVTTTVSLALTLPVLLSFLIYGETPGPRKWAGLALAALSIVLIQGKER